LSWFTFGCGARDGLGVSAFGGASASGGLGAASGTGGTGGTGGAPAVGGAPALGGAGTGGAACSPDVSRDPANCGRCGHSCLGGECANGWCQPVVLDSLGNTGANALALDAESVFWVSPAMVLSKLGGRAKVLAPAPPVIFGIAVDHDDVFWTDLNGFLQRVPKTGGAPQSLALGGYRVALDDSYAYTAWTDVHRVPKGGGTVETLADFGGQGIAVDDDSVYFTTWGSGIPGKSDGGLFKVPKAGGPVLELAVTDCSSYVTTYGDTVYWGNQCGSAGVRAIPKLGGTVTLLAGAGTPYGIAADADGVYWADHGGWVSMLPTEGGQPVTLADGQFAPRDLAVDADAVYFTNDSSMSSIVKVAKP